MPLSSGKKKLESRLKEIYEDTKEEKTVPFMASKMAQGCYEYVITGVPKVIITTFGGSVSGAQTVGSVKGKGLGGIDKPVPGMGLPAAKAILEKDLIRIWTHGNANRTAAKMAREMADAIHKYFSQAIVMTKEETAGPRPAPPPVGPVAGTIKGKGGLTKDAYGTGYGAAKPKLQAELIRIWKQIDRNNPRTVKQFAKELSTAIHNFCKEAKVDTTGTFLAMASVATPPAPPVGSYSPGVGQGSGKLS